MEKTKVSMVPTGQILARLVHPSVFAQAEFTLPLADPEISEKDGVTSYTYTGKAGRILVRNDGIRVLIEVWHKTDKILMCAIRDRKLDGTDGSSPLTFYPNIDPACNRLPGADFSACELSIYSWDPQTFIDGLATEGALGNFIADPDYYVWKNFHPAVFFPLWEQAFHIGRGPWQSARPMKGVPQFFVKEAIKLLTELGYHRVDAVPSWFNVARFFERLNFRFTYGEHELAYQALCQGLAEFNSGDGAAPLTVLQETWLVVLQNLPESHIPDELKLAARWPVTHTNSYWVRMHLDLNPYEPVRAAQSVAAPEEGRLMRGIRALRMQACSDSTMVKVSSRRHCKSCRDALGASSPGATSPSATTREEKSPPASDTACDASPEAGNKNGGSTS